MVKILTLKSSSAKNKSIFGGGVWYLKREEGNTYGDEKVFSGLPWWLSGKESAF